MINRFVLVELGTNSVDTRLRTRLFKLLPGKIKTFYLRHLQARWMVKCYQEVHPDKKVSYKIVKRGRTKIIEIITLSLLLCLTTPVLALTSTTLHVVSRPHYSGEEHLRELCQVKMEEVKKGGIIDAKVFEKCLRLEQQDAKQRK